MYSEIFLQQMKQRKANADKIVKILLKDLSQTIGFIHPFVKYRIISGIFFIYRYAVVPDKKSSFFVKAAMHTNAAPI